MKNFFKKNGWAFWLGISLGIAKVHLFSWQFYVVIVPTAILVSLSRKQAISECRAKRQIR